MPRDAYFFGTFNPVHLGHLLMAECALSQFGPGLGFSRVVFVPAARPPHRDIQSLAPFAKRLQWLEAATADNPGFAVSDIEQRVAADNPEPTYTWEILKHLLAAEELAPKATRIPLIMGTDALAHIESWHEAPRLLAHCVFLEAVRPGGSLIHTDASVLQRQTIEMPASELSASWIRARAAAGGSLRYAVPENPRVDIESAYRTGGLP